MLEPFVNDADFTLYVGDALDVLREMDDGSFHCCVTSPPYWGLRDYGTGTWEGGDDECNHQIDPRPVHAGGRDGNAYGTPPGGQAARSTTFSHTCGRCGATRVDRQLGLEATPDEYVGRMVEVFREVRRVLRSDGTCWLNLGDSYASAWACDRRNVVGNGSLENGKREDRPNRLTGGLKEKDLVGIPWSVAKALQEPYYTGRIPLERDRVWLAAILDGEGTICGMRHVRPESGNVRTGCMTFITNTSEPLLDECDRIWKGSRYSEKVTSEVSRPCWRWELQSAEDRSAFVRELYPYLIEKKRQALVAWNLLEIVQDAKRLGRGGENAETKAKRDLLVRILSDLNGRRPVDLPSWLREPPGLYEPGWYLRSDVIWSKSNPMPESVTDRPTKAHEYLFLLTKSARYFYDADAVREPHSPDGRRKTVHDHATDASHPNYDNVGNGNERWPNGGRNKRSVWEIATESYSEAHFATFPQALVEPCVKAGCPEWVCGTCGKPRERIVERHPLVLKEPLIPITERRGDAVNDKRTALSGTQLIPASSETVGWTDCGHDNYQPGVVLDPFMGSGTTALVARRLGRRSVGIELNAEYAELAARRLQQQSILA